jgi:hypothetical protein
MVVMEKKRNVKTVEKEIPSFFREERRMPTYKEVLDLLGVRSKSVVHYWMEKLCAMGVLARDSKGFLKPVRFPPGNPWPEPSLPGIRHLLRKSFGTLFPSMSIL